MSTNGLPVDPFLFAQQGDSDDNFIYTVPASGEVQPYTATATFTNGSGQAIQPTISIYSAQGNLLARVFPVEPVADGDSAEVTWMPPFGSAASTPSPSGATFVALTADLIWGATSGFYSIPSNDDGVKAVGTGLASTSIAEWEINLSATYTGLMGGAVTIKVLNLDTQPHFGVINWATVQELGTSNRQKLPVNPSATLAASTSTLLPFGASTLPNTLLTIDGSGNATWTATGNYALTASIIVSN